MVIVLKIVNVRVRITIINHHHNHDYYPDRSFYGIKKDYTFDIINLYFLYFRNILWQPLKFTELLYGHEWINKTRLKISDGLYHTI
jgi:hypothetical protein